MESRKDNTMGSKIKWTEIIIIVLTAIGGFSTLYLNEQNRLNYENYIRREKRFSELVSCIHGFSEEKNDAALKEKFIRELDLCWLYCSDDVIKKAYAFLNSMHVEKKNVQRLQKQALGELMVAIRKDLFKNERITSTHLTSSDFEYLGAR